MADFGIDTSGNVVIPTLPQAAQSGLTLSGGGAAQLTSQPQLPSIGAAASSLQVQVQNDEAATAGTLDAINKLSKGALQPYVDQLQKEAYFDGQAQVVQGRSLQDIENEQPWYTKIFGPSATVQGAQAMAITTALSNAQTQFLNDMPYLRTQDTSVVRQYLVNQAKDLDTGDPHINAVAQAKMAEGWQVMLEAHTKQRYAYIQQENVKAFAQMHLADGTQLQAALGQADGMLSPETAQMFRERTLAGLAQPPGMDDASYKQAMTQTAQANLANGNFGWFRILRNSGAWQALGPDSQKQLLDAQQRYESQYKTKASTEEFGVALAQITAKAGMGYLSPNEIVQQARDLNAYYARKTGAESPFINDGELTQLIRSGTTATYKALERADAKQEKLDEAQAKVVAQNEERAHYVRAARAGLGAEGYAGPGGNKDTFDAMFQMMYNQDEAKERGSGFKLLADNYLNTGYINKPVADQLQVGVRSSIASGFNDGFANSYDTYQKILNAGDGGPAVAQAYFGDYGVQMQKYHYAVSNGVDPATAYQNAFSVKPNLDAGIARAGGRAEFVKSINNAIDSHFGSLPWKQDKLSDYARNLVVDEVSSATSARVDGTGWSVDQAAKIAVANSRADIMGPDAYIRAPNQQTVGAQLRIPNDAMGDVWKAVRDRKFAAVGADPSNMVSLTRLAGKNVSLVATYLDRHGNVAVMPISGDELNAEFESNLVKKYHRTPLKVSPADRGTAPLSNTQQRAADILSDLPGAYANQQGKQVPNPF